MRFPARHGGACRLTSLLISLTRSIPSRSCRIGSNSSPIPGRPPFSARARHGSFNCCRQSGKSTTTAAVALHTAVYNPGLILLVSPSLRQSKELFAKVTGFLKDLEPAEVLAGSTSAALARSPAPGQEARAGDRVQPQLGLTRFGGHPESLARGAADAKNTSTVFAGVSPTDGRPRPCWT